jgi:hypothetical protein
MLLPMDKAVNRSYEDVMEETWRMLIAAAPALELQNSTFVIRRVHDRGKFLARPHLTCQCAILKSGYCEPERVIARVSFLFSNFYNIFN